MQRNSLNTKGFGLVGVLMIVVALVVVGGSGAYVYHRDHKSKSPAVSDSSTTTKTSTHTSTTTAATDQYAGWLSSSLKREGLMFKYPSSWTLADDSQTAGVCTPNAQNCPDRSIDSVSLTSPSGLALGISAGDDPANLAPRLQGQGCPAPQDTCTQYANMPITVNNKSLYMVITGYKEYNVAENLYLGLTQYPNCILNCGDGLGAAKKLPGNIQVDATYPNRNDPTYTEFDNDAAVKDAELVIESLHY
jgi:hypothetical protein